VDNTELCKALFDAFENGDEERVRALCTIDIQARQNNNPPMDLDTLLDFSRAVLRVVKDFRYEDAKRSSTATGFVEEHYVRGILPDGSKLDVAVCVVADVNNGKVCHLREYLDLSAAAGLIEALS
jgi:ketosteroid isomerase-like protein